MLAVQDNYLRYLAEVQQELEKLNLSAEMRRSFNIEILREALNGAELLVPVIGAFSAGKSSLLNSFLGKSSLPVGITPETALATELRYSNDEYIEAIKRDGSPDRYAITEIEQIVAKAKDYKFLRMYLNNNNLATIEPLVLVDMPGFDSPLDLHNQAISEYLNKGTHYIVLTSVEDGNITRSMVRQLTGIQAYGRSFSFFLSKANLRSDSEVKDIAVKIEEQLDEYFDFANKIIAIDNNGGDSLSNILKEIDPEKLFKNIFADDLKESYYKISEAINTSISSLKKGKDANEQDIAELQRGLNEVTRKRDELFAEAAEKYSNVNISRIVNAVGKELSNSVDELIAAAVRSGESGLSQKIAEITRLSLIEEVKSTMGDIGRDIIGDFSIGLSSLSSTTISEDWLQKITDSTKTFLDKAQSGMGSIIDQRNKSGNNDKIYKIITTVLALTTTIISPILEVLIIFLPDLISGLFASMQQKKQEEQIRNSIMTQTIPSIKRALREKLPAIFEEQVQHLINDISKEFESKLQDKKAAIAAIEEEKRNKIVDIDGEISRYRLVLENITGLANHIVFSKAAG